MRLIFKTILWFSVVLFLIAQDKGVLDRVEESFAEEELNVDTILQAQALLDKVDRLCQNHADECRRLGDLALDGEDGN